MTADARRLAAAIRQRNGTRRRVPLAAVRAAFERCWPDRARQPDARAQLGALLEQAAREGLLTLSRQQDRAGLPCLPAHVLLPRAPAADRPPRPSVVWHDQLAWARDLPPARLSDKQFGMLVSVNRWLRDGGAQRPIVPAEERSLELFDDEKAISARAGGDTLWAPGRLTLELLRCERVTTPFVWEPCGNGTLLLVVENQATFHSLLRVLRRHPGHGYGGVAWGQGEMAPSRIAYATRLPFTVTQIHYFGDLDVQGLRTAQATCAAAQQAGIRAGPQEALWRWLLGCRPCPATPVPPAQAAAAAAWLPSTLQEAARQLLTAGRRIPQERLGFEQLDSDTTWSRP